MTKEEAIEVISQDIPCEHDADLIEALKMAIKALEQEPCEDAVSRQAVDEIKELMTDINGDTVYAVRMSDIRQLLPVTPTRPKGHWIDGKCSKCGEYSPYWSFCPCCGADMREGE